MQSTAPLVAIFLIFERTFLLLAKLCHVTSLTWQPLVPVAHKALFGQLASDWSDSRLLTADPMYKKRQIVYCAVQGVPKKLRLLLLTRFSLYITKKNLCSDILLSTVLALVGWPFV